MAIEPHFSKCEHPGDAAPCVISFSRQLSLALWRATTAIGYDRKRRINNAYGFHFIVKKIV
jgi:hypothetical protein